MSYPIARSVKSVIAEQFEVQTQGDDCVIVEVKTGRPFGQPMSAALAEFECDTLNQAAASGGRTLLAALGAIEDAADYGGEQVFV
jgi:hypothetical protein